MIQRLMHYLFGTPDERLADLYDDLDLAEITLQQATRDVAVIRSMIADHKARHGAKS